ncbi:hypothetical protein GGF43_003356 [Coemansia sp. RSA 2618]|nr:hypothetical protein GGF43_003356 [Coemansia sp. RSA 2618]
MSEDSLVRRAAQALDAITTDLGWQPPAAGNDASSDDDSWLALDADELDTVMRKAEAVLQDASQGDPELMPGDGEDDQTAQDLQSMLAKFEAFLAADSGIEAESVSNDTPVNPSKDDSKTALSSIMSAMDHELSGTSVGKSFFRHDQAEPAQEDDDLEYELDDVNVDLNLVQNIVESFQAQEGLPGPAGTMLGQAGIHLPHSGGASGSNANSDGADM